MFHGWCEMPGCVIDVIGIGGSMTKPIPAPHKSRNNNNFRKNSGTRIPNHCRCANRGYFLLEKPEDS